MKADSMPSAGGGARKTFRRSLILILVIVAVVFSTLTTLSPWIGSGNYLLTWNQIFRCTGLVPDTEAARPSVHFIDVGQGDAILFRSGDCSALVDAGPSADDGNRVVNYLQRQGVTRLDAVIATHPHEDHIGGMSRVLERFRADLFLFDDAPVKDEIDSTIAAELLRIAARCEVTVTPPQVGLKIVVGEFVLTVLYADSTAENENDRSVVILAECHGQRFLLMGDAEKETEKLLLLSGVPLACEVLKAGHHGSATSTTPDFLVAADPGFVVFSCGVGNRFGHPSPGVSARVEQSGIRALRTDLMGTVSFYIDKKDGLVLETNR